MLAVTARSTTYSEKEVDCAIQQCAIFGVKHIIIKTEELENPEFASNPLNRCYHCKTELFSKLKSIADEKKIKYVADATNYDDVSDYRPGILKLQKNWVLKAR